MRKYLVYGFIILFIFYLSGCVTIYNPATEKQETYFINDDSEIAIGKNIAKDILQNNRQVSDSVLINYVRRVGNKVAQKSDRTNLEYNFYVLDKDEINAFALPGGYVFVNKGLLDKVDEGELAFILGHEIGHICARHSVKKLQTSLGVNVLLSIALQNPKYQQVTKAAGVVYNIIDLGYSRQDELLADSLGLKYICGAGYNPQVAINALEKLKNEDKGTAVIVFLRSHPLPQERIKNIKKKIAELRL